MARRRRVRAAGEGVRPFPQRSVHHGVVRPPPRRAVILVLAVLFGGTLTVAQAAAVRRGIVTMAVEVNGREVRVPRSRPTVARALREAGANPRDGALLSVATKRVLDPHHAPARVFVDGRPAERSSRVDRGARITVVDGRDAMELTKQREVTVPAQPPPRVERHLWYGGVDGRAIEMVGEVSGEVASREVVAEPVAPRQETGPVLALTFDDGPSPTWTPQVLDVLSEEGVRATFCLVGEMARKRPELTATIRDRGHAVCNHTQTHPPNLQAMTRDEVAREALEGAATLESLLGQRPRLFRPPGGRIGPDVVAAAHEHGFRVLYWTVDARDHSGAPAPVLLERVLAGVGPGGVILLHDGGGRQDATLAMLRPLIHELRARGYSFATPLD